MKLALFLVLGCLASLPVLAEDWTTSDGKTYKDVKVVSHDDAYVTILDDRGGGRVLIATLSPDLQKQFGYDPVKAAAAIAKVAAQDERDKEAVAREQAASQASAQQGQDALNAAVAQASLPPPPGTSTPVADTTPDASAPPSGDVANEGPAYGTSEIDNSGYGYYGGYGYGPGIIILSNGQRRYINHPGTGGGFVPGSKGETTTHTFTTGTSTAPTFRAVTTGLPAGGATTGTTGNGHH
jgi:hypothetical protein